MRNSELRTGIEVFDEKGEAVGTSKVAAKKVSQDILMCMCSKGPNALYNCGEVWNRKPYHISPANWGQPLLRTWSSVT